MRRYHAALAAFLLALVPAAAPAAGDPREALLVEDLAADGARAARHDMPIVMLLSASYCSYCDLVREDFLVPMVISGSYDDRVILRELPIDGPLVRDFDGERRLAGDIADRYHASLVPVVLFLDGDGREIARRMVGINTVDFFGAYLEAAMTEARAAMKAKDRAP